MLKVKHEDCNPLKIVIMKNIYTVTIEDTNSGQTTYSQAFTSFTAAVETMDVYRSHLGEKLTGDFTVRAGFYIDKYNYTMEMAHYTVTVRKQEVYSKAVSKFY